MNRKNFWIGFVAALAFGVVGCGDDSGSGGTGGTGGIPMGTANVTAVHLAPEVPSAESTAVALFVDGEEQTALGTLEYSQSTGKIALPVGTYDIGIGVPGEADPLLELNDVELTEGDDLVVVAYRTNNVELPVDVFVFVNSTEGLASGEGRVFVGHGANDSALDPVDISLGEEPDCSTLIPGFEFGTTAPADGLDLAEGTYQIGFDLTPDDMNDCADFGPVGVPVTRNVVSILIAVDEDTTDTSEDMNALNPELWAIIPDAEDPQPIRTIQTTP